MADDATAVKQNQTHLHVKLDSKVDDGGAVPMRKEYGQDQAELLAKLGVVISGGSKGISQKDHGHIGGLVAGRLGSNKYVADYAVDSRSKCRYPSCRGPIQQGVLRIGKIPPALRTGHAIRTHWYHPECIFKSFLRMTKSTKTIHSTEDLQGYDLLMPQDKETIKRCIEHRSDVLLDVQAEEIDRTKSIRRTISGMMLPTMHRVKPVISTVNCPASSDESELSAESVARCENWLRAAENANAHNRTSEQAGTARTEQTLYALDAQAVAAKIAGLGDAFKTIAARFVECSVDGKYILSQTPAEFDEILVDFGMNDSATGRQKRRRICYELGIY